MVNLIFFFFFFYRTAGEWKFKSGSSSTSIPDLMSFIRERLSPSLTL